jgi:transcriptional regulator with XRE-family HTH domain
MSAATLSRIENDKQGLELGTFLLLAKILKCLPTDLIGADGNPNNDTLDPAMRELSVLSSAERIRLWRRLATEARGDKVQDRRSATRHLAQQVEELLAQLEYVQAEVETVRKRLRVR